MATVSDFMLERLGAWGVDRIYGYPGDGINGILGALARAEDRFEFIQAPHEEVAAFMACAHAKFTGRPGVCMATSGPGAIHLLNGLYDAASTTRRWSRSSASRSAPRSAATTSRRSTCSVCSRTWPATTCRCAPRRRRCAI